MRPMVPLMYDAKSNFSCSSIPCSFLRESTPFSDLPCLHATEPHFFYVKPHFISSSFLIFTLKYATFHVNHNFATDNLFCYYGEFISTYITENLTR